jgi:hypothetical protein
MNSLRVSDSRERPQDTDIGNTPRPHRHKGWWSAAAVGNTDVLNLRENPGRIDELVYLGRSPTRSRHRAKNWRASRPRNFSASRSALAPPHGPDAPGADRHPRALERGVLSSGLKRDGRVPHGRAPRRTAAGPPRRGAQARIPLEQFWPEGESDADTTKVKVEVGEDAFRFREHAGAEFRITHAFDKARQRE